MSDLRYDLCMCFVLHVDLRCACFAVCLAVLYEYELCLTACVAPPVILDSEVSVNGYTDGSVATYTCNTGFLASGSLQKVCRSGVWTSGREPLCTGKDTEFPLHIFLMNTWPVNCMYVSVIGH